jgi:hypothetical protein
MKKVIIGAVIVGAGIAAFVMYRKYNHKNFDKNCKANGGKLIESGKTCSL